MNRVTQDFDYAKDIRLFRLADFLLGKQRKVFEKKEERMDYHYNQWFRMHCSCGACIWAAVH